MLALRTTSRGITKGISTNCSQANMRSIAHHGLFYLKCQFIVLLYCELLYTGSNADIAEVEQPITVNKTGQSNEVFSQSYIHKSP